MVQHLVKGLLEAGYEVVGLDRICNQSCDGRYFHYVVDLADKDTLQFYGKYKPIELILFAALCSMAADG